MATKIQERIETFAVGMRQTPEKAVRFTKFHLVKMVKLLDDIKRYLVDEFEGDQRLQFTSQDLRSLTIALASVHKILNKKVLFDQLEKRTISTFRAEIKEDPKRTAITRDTLLKVTRENDELIWLASEVQALICWFSKYAFLTKIVERDYAYAKIKDEQALKNALDDVAEMLRKK